jgi:Zinc-binding loop region of homing endonuclease
MMDNDFFHKSNSMTIYNHDMPTACYLNDNVGSDNLLLTNADSGVREKTHRFDRIDIATLVTKMMEVERDAKHVGVCLFINTDLLVEVVAKVEVDFDRKEGPKVSINGRGVNPSQAMYLATRRKLFIGANHIISHLCGRGACVNPLHLIQESKSENMLRKLCHEGHELQWYRWEWNKLNPTRKVGRLNPKPCNHEPRCING